MSPRDSLDSFSVVSMPGCDDPITQLEQHIGFVVATFSDGHQMIKDSMEQDQINAKSLNTMEEHLRSLGDHRAANCLVQRSKDALDHSLKQVVPMRQHIEEIAQLLNEVVDPEIQADASSLTSIMLSVQDESKKACAIAATGTEKFQAITKELQGIQAEYQATAAEARKQVEEAQANVEKYKEMAEMKRTRRNASAAISAVSSTVPVAKTGVAGACLAFGAEATASIPLIGQVLTTTTAGVAAFNPVGVAVGVGFGAVFGLIAIKSYFDANDASYHCQQALESKATAETEVEAKQGVAEKAEETEQVAGAMVVKARVHKEMWGGVAQSAEKAATTFSTLKRIDPTGARRKRFEDKMKAYAEDLLYFVQAIDQYLFFLYKQGFFPPTFRIENAMGKDRFLKVQKEFEATYATPAAPGLKHEATEATEAMEPMEG